MKIKPMTIEIERDTWIKFKAKVPKTRKLNGTVIELIEAYANDRTIKN